MRNSVLYIQGVDNSYIRLDHRVGLEWESSVNMPINEKEYDILNVVINAIVSRYNAEKPQREIEKLQRELEMATKVAESAQEKLRELKLTSG